MEFKHIPVLKNEVLEALNLPQNKLIVDGTIGGGGHSEAILTSGNGSSIIGFDRDAEAIASSKKRLEQFGGRVTFVKSNYKNIPQVLDEMQTKVDGVLLDLGVSSYQLDNPERGFSFRSDAKLDMRMDREDGITAEEILNTYTEKELTKIFKQYGEEKYSSSIAREIIKKRPLHTTGELRALIESLVPPYKKYDTIGTLQRIFQALRIEVNDELNGLYELILELPKHINKGGRIAIITFHPLEDKIVKDAYIELAKDCICPPSFPKCVCNHRSQGTILNKKPIMASKLELENNSRASSAKLRVFEVN